MIRPLRDPTLGLWSAVLMLWSDLFPSEDPTGNDPLRTTDPAFCSDWVIAIATAREKGLPEHSPSA